jgi:hypothetical protein
MRNQSEDVTIRHMNAVAALAVAGLAVTCVALCAALVAVARIVGPGAQYAAEKTRAGLLSRFTHPSQPWPSQSDIDGR